MSLPTNANQPTGATSKVPFGCMDGYTNLVFAEEAIEVLCDLEECLGKLKSDKFRNQVIGDRNVLLASMRVAAFVEHFNSCQDDTVHHCTCSTSHPPGTLSSVACMHPGDWDFTRVVRGYWENDQCLVCGVFITGDMAGCVHRPLHEDCYVLDGQSVIEYKGRYTGRFASFIRNDVKHKADEDATTKSLGERKALIVLRRLESKHDHWFMSAKLSNVEASTY